MWYRIKRFFYYHFCFKSWYHEDGVHHFYAIEFKKEGE
jgi:hypothetical protein